MCLKCLTCLHESNTYESMVDVCLHITQRSIADVGAAFASFTATEVLSGKNEYKCDKKSATKPSEPCWKSKKRGPGFGYKEISLHNSSEHGLFESIIAEDERPEIRNLAAIIEQYLSP